MSKYTTEVRFICESLSGLNESAPYSGVDEVISKSRGKIFDFPYPLFDESYKPELEKKILLHYYTREISEETYGLWKLRLRTKLNEIMPYYNQLYESELIKFNPLWDSDLATERDVKTDNEFENETVRDDDTKKRGNDTTQAGGTDTTSANYRDKVNTWNLFSDTPQGSIKGIEGAEDDPSLGDNGYLTNARHTIGDTNGSTRSGQTNYGKTSMLNYNSNIKFDGDSKTDGTSNQVVDFFEKVTGYRGSNPSESLKKFRETFLNIDMMIIKDLSGLFFNLW